VSSSGHVALLPHLLGWGYGELPPNVRKTFEVALHAGSAPALVLALRREPRLDGLLALTLAPPALAGLLLERFIEEHLGGPRSVAVAQVVAGAALLVADRVAERRATPTASDHLAVGAAQALALVPGVSRSGAALTAARARGLTREAAASLALRAAIPVTAGAGLLKGARIVREGVAGDLRTPLAAGAAAALVSALAALPLARNTRWTPVVAYRIALGLGTLWRGRKNGGNCALRSWRVRPIGPMVEPSVG
jgi:undecaprenyl-diphosphatase